MTKEKLLEYIETKVLSIAKFKTHRLRKAFFADINNAVEQFTNAQKAEKPIRYSDAGITRPNPNGSSTAPKVMTESESAKYDAFFGRAPK